MYRMYGYLDTGNIEFLGGWDSFANAISAAGWMMDTGIYANVVVKVADILVYTA